MKKNDDKPVVDPSQDYVLLLGYENATHTVLRFKRKLDTCDISYDIPITVSLNKVLIFFVLSSIKPGVVCGVQHQYLLLIVCWVFFLSIRF